MATIGSLIVNVEAQTGQFVKGLDRAKSGLGSLQKSMASFITSASGLGTLLGAGALGAGLRSCVQDFMEDERAAKLLDSQIRATGASAGLAASTIRDMSSSLQETTRFADETTNAAAGVLLSFKAIKGDTFREAMTAAQDLSTVMGQDLQTSVVQIGKALSDPVSGLTALRRVGVMFTEDQKNMIKTLVETGDVLGAQKLILAELAGEFGGAATADAKSFAGQMDVLKNQFGELKEAIGAIIPVTMDAFNDLLKLGGVGGTSGLTDFVNMMSGRTQGDANSRANEAGNLLREAEKLTNAHDYKGAREKLKAAGAIKQTDSGFDMSNAIRFHENRIKQGEDASSISFDEKTRRWSMKGQDTPVRGTASFGGLFDPKLIREAAKLAKEKKKADEDEIAARKRRDESVLSRADLVGAGPSAEEDARIKAYRESLMGPNLDRPGALQAGTVEAFSASQRSQNALNDPMEKVVKSNKEILTEAQKNNRLISDTNSGIKQLNASLGAAEVVA